jgi:hypothetical protein
MICISLKITSPTHPRTPTHAAATRTTKKKTKKKKREEEETTNGGGLKTHNMHTR